MVITSRPSPLSFSGDASPLYVQSPTFNTLSSSSRSRLLLNGCLQLHITRCSRANDASLETANVESAAFKESILTETKKAALDVGRGSNLVAFYSDHHSLPWLPSAKPPLDKCQATRLMLESDVPFKNLLVTLPAPLAGPDELCLVYEERYIQSIFNEELNDMDMQRFGFSWSHELLIRSCASAGGAIAAMHMVMLGLRLAAANIGGHGISNHVEGFPLVPSGIFNDVAVAVSVALKIYPNICNSRKPILVIDLDVHQRTDTSQCFEKDNRVMTFNFHGTSNTPWHTNIQRDNDSGLLDCTGDDYYLAMLYDKLEQLLDFCSPGLIFFQAGVDALGEDVSGKLSMTRQGLLHRNNIVYTACFTRKIPLVITMGSGYSKSVEACLEAHADVFRAAALRYGTSPKEP